MKEINIDIEKYDKVKMTLKTGEYVIFKILNLREVSKLKPLIVKLEDKEKKDEIDDILSTTKEIWNMLVVEHNLGEIDELPISQFQQIIERIVGEQTIKKKAEK